MATQDADIKAYIAEKVASGEFETEEAFTSEAIRVYREMETDYNDLRSTVRDRLRQADEGYLAPLDTESIIAELEAKINEDGSPR